MTLNRHSENVNATFKPYFEPGSTKVLVAASLLGTDPARVCNTLNALCSRLGRRDLAALTAPCVYGYQLAELVARRDHAELASRLAPLGLEPLLPGVLSIQKAGAGDCGDDVPDRELATAVEGEMKGKLTMQFRAAKATVEKAEDRDLDVYLSLGEMWRAGCWSEAAFVWLTPEAAEALAEELQQAARKVRNRNT